MVGHGGKITFGEMRAAGYTAIIVSCSDFKCSHSTVISAEQWPQRCAALRYRAAVCLLGVLREGR
jgi:hypothetical protein